MGTWEWPLIIFTVLGEAAIGILLALWWLDRTPLDSALYKKATLTSGALLALALIASLAHLGHPEAAYRAISHLSSSWLSREILFFLLTAAAWIYLFFQTRQPQGNRRLAAGITALLGLLGVLSSSMIYVLPRVPAWDSAQTPFFFLLTTGLLGALTLLVLGHKALTPGQTSTLIYWSATCIVASLLSYGLYLSLLNAGSSESVATVQFISASPLFWVRVLTNWLAPLILLYFIIKNKKAANLNLILLLLVTSGLGELLGRSLFYLSAVGIHITALK
ncbi:DmsC/YnfH family molybdoenzyme membrane anchor subunit [Desulfosporosinus sp. PR]|uniref:dimethyl sulfoxide reductase anchor subunit family protein n=1 Tax=Candidatus Desulfosporosinus nitrosoreducens TaxID=3401928 RepID=UPI0028004EFA|nr:DmsC/YnfH family molybdoenzyme membrane anchor subunit [Desulfosporosinus sp. PR]MDQ7094059.1 DmsC/YnfH family molybdoenzyme membrane anchor subunit [Desulfosporosinus sp. PR]